MTWTAFAILAMFVSSKGLFSKFSLVFLLLVLESLVASWILCLGFLEGAQWSGRDYWW